MKAYHLTHSQAPTGYLCTYVRIWEKTSSHRRSLSQVRHVLTRSDFSQESEYKTDYKVLITSDGEGKTPETKH
jgi:hypothetical protein